MKFCFYGFLVIFLIVPPVTANFFPNISALPPPLLQNATHNIWGAFKNFSGCNFGDKIDGLSKLKQYFQRFGYVPENFSGNFTDDFDDMFKNAIETYQRNFQLNVTGELDELTIGHMVVPRCGNPDIVNGTSTMHGGRKYEINTNGDGHRFHAVKHYTFFPGQPRWPESRRDLTYAFQPQNALTEEVKSVFARAFTRWSEVTQLTFTRVETYSSADIKIGFYTRDHGDGEAFDGVLGTLGHAFSPPSGQLHLDGDENWVVGGDLNSLRQVTSAVDLESVAVHEIGHLLGLGHSSVEESIMYPKISTSSRKVDLATDDIEGIQYLYGANPNYDGRSTTPMQQRETGNFGGAHNIDPSRVTSLCVSLTIGLLLWFSS